MFRLLLVSLCVSLAVGKTINRPDLDWDSRIVGGTDAVAGQVPNQVSLRSSNNVHFCGGSLLNNRWIMSAAQCTAGRTLFNTQVVVGTLLLNSGGIAHQVSTIINHPDYNAATRSNDISVVQTATTIVYTNNVHNIGLASSFAGDGWFTFASGWGQTSNPGAGPTNNLQIVLLLTITNDECRSSHTAENANFIYNTTLCTSTNTGNGICMGDSGGPLVFQETVIGVASWNIPCAAGWPDAWTRVASYRTWVMDTINSVV